MEEMKILFLSPEAVPFAKSGGLADVAGSLPLALKRLGMDVRLIIPYYQSVKEGKFDNQLLIKNLEVPMGDEHLECDVREGTTEGGDLPVYFVEREDLYERHGLYGNEKGDYYDNLERFAFFAHSALKLAQYLHFVPHIIHCHDWQTGLIPALLKGPYHGIPAFSKTSTVFTIHNMGYQGIFPAGKLPLTGLPHADFFHMRGVEYWGNISLLKAGMVYADAVTTVSPTYAREIQTPEYGMGMEGVLHGRRESLSGILNGIDYGRWDPGIDPVISAPYCPDRMTGKRKCKEFLMREMNIKAGLRRRPLLAMISRLDAQKGLDLLVKILNDILALDVGLVVLGSGDEGIHMAIKEASENHPGKVGIHIGFNDPLAHQILAGADIFLIPSRYEPCGLTQMYALKYAAVPVVRATGGLNDTVTQYNKKTGKGNGFKFGPYKAGAFLQAIRQAVSLYGDSKMWRQIISNGMSMDFSWESSAKKYEEIYASLLKKRNQQPPAQLAV